MWGSMTNDPGSTDYTDYSGVFAASGQNRTMTLEQDFGAYG